jgi:type IV fimbrial biogenesis protein FimT
MRTQRGFTLIELLIVIALVAVVLTLAGPAFYDFILVQRLRGINSQLVTDMQLARSEAVARSTLGRVVFASDAAMTCYTLYTLKPGSNTGLRCDCTLSPGSACADANAIEVRTVQVPRSTGVHLTVTSGGGTGGTDPAMAFDPVTGGLVQIPTDRFPRPLAQFVIEATIDTPRTLRTTINPAGRPTVCGTSATLGATPC